MNLLFSKQIPNTYFNLCIYTIQHIFSFLSTIYKSVNGIHSKILLRDPALQINTIYQSTLIKIKKLNWVTRNFWIIKWSSSNPQIKLADFKK